MADAAQGGGFLRGAIYGVIVSGAGLAALAGLVPLESGMRPVFDAAPAGSAGEPVVEAPVVEEPDVAVVAPAPVIEEAPVVAETETPPETGVASLDGDPFAPVIAFDAPSIPQGQTDSPNAPTVRRSDAPTGLSARGSAPSLSSATAGGDTPNAPSVNTQTAEIPQVDTGAQRVTTEGTTSATPIEPTNKGTDTVAEEPAAKEPEIKTAVVTEEPVITPEDITPVPAVVPTDEVYVVPPADIVAGDAFTSNRVAFEGDPSQPFLAIVLRDVGDEGVAREALFDLGVPITVALPVTMDGAAGISRTYFAKGIETVALLPDAGTQMISRGMDASVVSANLGGFLAAVPTAVGVMDRVDGDMPRDANLVRTLIDSLKVSGHGILTHRSGGLNSVDRLARTEGLQSATVYQEIDANSDPRSIQSALDKAVFEASRSGAAVVVGTTRPETVTTLFSWLISNGSKSVTIAPVSVAMEALSTR